MNNKFNYIFLNIFIFIFIFIPSFNNANEILIYADSISYDENENIVARGNAKIYQDSELIISDLIIYSKSEEKIILPSKFTYKDSNNNFYEGENGYFSKTLNNAEFYNPKNNFKLHPIY